MYTRKATLINPNGLHARPIMQFVTRVSGFQSNITLKKLDESGAEVISGPAGSIVYVMLMDIAQGTEIELFAEGPDEKAAVDELVTLIESGFGEI